MALSPPLRRRSAAAAPPPAPAPTGTASLHVTVRTPDAAR